MKKKMEISQRFLLKQVFDVICAVSEKCQRSIDEALSNHEPGVNSSFIQRIVCLRVLRRQVTRIAKLFTFLRMLALCETLNSLHMLLEEILRQE